MSFTYFFSMLCGCVSEVNFGPQKHICAVTFVYVVSLNRLYWLSSCLAFNFQWSRWKIKFLVFFHASSLLLICMPRCKNNMQLDSDLMEIQALWQTRCKIGQTTMKGHFSSCYFYRFCESVCTARNLFLFDFFSLNLLKQFTYFYHQHITGKQDAVVLIVLIREKVSGLWFWKTLEMLTDMEYF